MSADTESAASGLGRTARRAWLYGAGLMLVSGLVYGGFVYEAEPDVFSVLQTVDFALKTANTLPEIDKHGKRLAYRDEELTRAEALLRKVEEREPGLSITYEMRAFARYLRHDWAEAAILYGRALEGKEAPPERRTSILVNLAEMEHAAGNTKGALATLDRAGSVAGTRIQVALCRARLLDKAGRRSEALEALRSVAALSSEDPARLLECGRMLEDLGDLRSAESAIEASVPGTGEVGLYYLATLKLRAGESDTALTTLVKAHQTGPTFVTKVLTRDHEIWEPLKTDPRLERLLGESARASAAPGR